MTLTVTSLGTSQNTTSSSSITKTGVTANIGDWLVVIVGADNAEVNGGASMTTASISDDAGNTYENKGGIAVRAPSAAPSSGSSLGCWVAEVTEVTSSAVITCAFSPNTRSKGMIVLLVEPSTDKSVAFRAVGSAVTGSGTTFSAATVSVDLGDTIFGFLAQESASWTNSGNGDTDTVNGSWTYPIKALASTGSNSSSIDTEVQWKSPSATGNQTFNSSLGVSTDYCINYLILGEDDAALPEILGDSDIADVDDALTSAAGLAIQAAFSVNDEADGVTSEGQLLATAVLNLTDEADVVVSDGQVLISAEASITDAADSLVSEGGEYIIVATSEITDEEDLLTSAATNPLLGALTLNDGDDALNAEGLLIILGVSSLTDATDALTAFGSSSNFGDAILVDTDDALTAAGTLPIVGVLSLTDQNDTMFASNYSARGRSGSAFVMWG